MIGSGMAAQIGWALESTVGTAVTPTAFAPFVSESMTRRIERVESDAVEAALVEASGDWLPGEDTVSGDVGFELYARGLTKLLTLMFGDVDTTSLGGGRYRHIYTPGVLTGISATIQVGKPDVAGTVVPFTYTGCKVESWELAVTANEYATLGLTVAAMAETTGVALATASYPAGIRPILGTTALTLDGTPLPGVRTVRFAGDNGLDTDRRHVADATTPDEPLEQQRRTYTVTLDGEFTDTDLYDLYTAGTEATLVARLTDQAGETVVLSANVRFDGTTPQVRGRGVLSRSIPLTCVAPPAGQAITVAVTNNSSTP